MAETEGMKLRPLLCELHAHTTWSDGVLNLPELVDLYGRNGFDVLAVTDHVIRKDDPFADEGHLCVHAANFDAYQDALAREAARAREPQPGRIAPPTILPSR